VGPFWQERYYDRKVRDEREHTANSAICMVIPVKHGLVKAAADRNWSSFRHYALREIGMVEIESPWTAQDRETKTSGGPETVFLSQSLP
jgi:hypothetical protein